MTTFEYLEKKQKRMPPNIFLIISDKKLLGVYLFIGDGVLLNWYLLHLGSKGNFFWHENWKKLTEFKFLPRLNSLCTNAL